MGALARARSDGPSSRPAGPPGGSRLARIVAAIADGLPGARRSREGAADERVERAADERGRRDGMGARRPHPVLRGDGAPGPCPARRRRGVSSRWCGVAVHGMGLRYAE